MARALWKGAINFGLVHIPVGLYPAARSAALDFTMLDRRNLAPVGYRRVNKETGGEVPWDEVVKGYEYEKGRYVVLSDEDFRRANVEATQTVDILAFVDAGRIPLTHFDTPYYLVPGKRGEKGYALLRETLKRAGKAGVATVVIRTKQHLALVVPLEGVLVLNTLRYADELHSASEIARERETLKWAKLSDKELGMALRLVEDMSEDWKPAKYRDTYRDDILARVEEKIKAGETSLITEPAREREKPQGAEVIDLMALLKRSVEEKGMAGSGADRNRVAGAAKKTAVRSARKRASSHGARRKRA